MEEKSFKLVEKLYLSTVDKKQVWQETLDNEQRNFLQNINF